MTGFSNDILNLIQAIMVLLVLVCLYAYWGYGLIKITGYKCHWSIIPVLGFIFDFFIYIIVEVPCCFFDITLSICTWIHLVLMSIYSIYLFIKYKKNVFIKELVRKNRQELIFVIVIILGILCVVNQRKSYYYYEVGDARWNCDYVSTILASNHIYRNDSYSGQYIGFNNFELFFYSYFPYLASLCKCFYVNVAIMFYRIFAAIVISFYVLIFYSIFEAYFESDYKKNRIAMVLFTIFSLCPQPGHGYMYWIPSGPSFAHGVVVGIYAPMIVLLLIEYIREKFQGFWIIFFLTTLTAVFINRSGAFIYLLLMVSSFIPLMIFMIRKNKIIDIFRYMMCCVPCLISIGFTYFI